MDFLTPTNITLVIMVLSVLFNIFQYFKNPQIALDKQQDVDRVVIDGKAGLLAEQVRWEREATEKRFNEVQVSIKEAFTLALNHSHTVEEKVTTLTGVVNDLVTQVSNLGIIIDERMPKK